MDLLRIARRPWMFALAWVALLQPVLADDSPQPPAEVLKADAGWGLVYHLDRWDRPLASDDVAALEAYLADARNDHWRARYSATKLLRKHDPRKYSAATAIERAEEIIASVPFGKGGYASEHEQVEALVAIGPEVVPYLAEGLNQRLRWPDHLVIEALGRMNDPRAIPSLKSMSQRTKDGYIESRLAQAALLALLRLDPGQGMVEYVIDQLVTSKHSSHLQDQFLTALERGDLSADTKFALLVQYQRLDLNARSRAFYSLAALNDRRSFDLLAGVVSLGPTEIWHRLGSPDLYHSAVGALGQCTAGDPGPILLEQLRRGVWTDSVVLVIAALRYQPAADELRRLMDRPIPLDSPDHHPLRIKTAGALCAIGKDYDIYSATVRSALRSDAINVRSAALKVAHYANDPATVEALVPLLEGDYAHFSLWALRRMNNPAAIAPLRRLVRSLPPAVEQPDLHEFGEAIESIGEANGDAAAVEEGRGIQDFTWAMDFLTSIHQSIFPTPEQQQKIDARILRAGRWLDRNRDFIPVILRHLDWTGAGEAQGAVSNHNRLGLLKLLDLAWDERAIAPLERIVKTDMESVSFLTNNGIVHHYELRSQAAAFLAKKTGRRYTYIDADGTEREGGQWPDELLKE